MRHSVYLAGCVLEWSEHTYVLISIYTHTHIESAMTISSIDWQAGEEEA